MALKMAMIAMIFLATFGVAQLRRMKFEKQAKIDAHSDKDDSKELIFEDKLDKADSVGAPVLASESPAALAQEDASQVSSPAVTSTASTPEDVSGPDSDADSQPDSETDSEYSIHSDSEISSDSDSDSLLLSGAEEDPEGLCEAVQAILEPFRGFWFITRGDSKAHEDYNVEVEPRLFCRKVPPHASYKDLIEETHDYKGGPSLGEDNYKPNLNYFKSSYSEEDLLEWFECDEEHAGYDDDDDDSDGLDVPICEQRKEYGRKVQSLFAQHGQEQFSYRLEYDEGLMTTDGIGVVTASGFAVGIEASLVYWDP